MTNFKIVLPLAQFEKWSVIILHWPLRLFTKERHLDARMFLVPFRLRGQENTLDRRTGTSRTGPRTRARTGTRTRDSTGPSTRASTGPRTRASISTGPSLGLGLGQKLGPGRREMNKDM